MKPAIVIDALTIVREQQTILQDLSLQVAPGTITGLIGPSGSGKSTLMRAIVGVQAITQGGITVLNQPAGSARLRSQIGYVTQSPAIYDDLTVLQNMAYFAAIIGVSKLETQRVLQQVDLVGQAKQLARTLSGGQRARVSLAIALLGNPPVLILDEPTVGLDPLLRQHLWQLFAELADAGHSLLISSHVMDEAERCAEIILLRQGRVLSHGSKQILLERTHTQTINAAFLQLVGGDA